MCCNESWAEQIHGILACVVKDSEYIAILLQHNCSSMAAPPQKNEVVLVGAYGYIAYGIVHRKNSNYGIELQQQNTL